MQNKTRFYKCEACGNIVGIIESAGVPLMCCGTPMEELVANSVDAATEKHIPLVEVDGDTICVTVGSVEHPMLEEHFIDYIYLETENGGQRKALKPGMPPKCKFKVVEDKPIAVYAYCNLHGLWKKEI